MKNRCYLIVGMLMVCFFSFAQRPITGIWEGKLKAAVTIRIVFFISMDNTGYVTILDSPDQGAKGIKTSGTIFSGDSLTVSIAQAGAKYRGRLINDSTIEGKWSQGMSLPLILKKVDKPSVVNRPQTPKPPFPYSSEDIIYYNTGKTIQYGATITIPKGKGPFPAMLMITGSGLQNRDEEILAHKPFAVIADYLTRNGFIVLRVDDRSMGQTTGDVKNATSRDFANDALVSLQYLMGRKEVNKHKVGLIGHSEGGMIAQMIAAERKDIDFIILMAAPGENNIDLMKDQNAAIARTAGLSKEYIDQYLQLYEDLVKTIIETNSTEEAKQKIMPVVNNWIAQTPQSVVLATTGIHDEISKENFINAFTGQLSTPWFKYFLKYDPDQNLKKIHAKVLALNGDRDIQVIAATNLPAMQASLKQSPSKDFEIKEMKGMNHLFQDCIKCTIQEYGELDETISPAALNVMLEWLNAHVQKAN